VLLGHVVCPNVAYMRPIATVVTPSMVCLFVCLSVCSAHGWAVQKTAELINIQRPRSLKKSEVDELNMPQIFKLTVTKMDSFR